MLRKLETGKLTVAESIANRLRDDILAGEFRSGQRLTYVELANRYGTSQMPIRESVQLLAGEGLIEIVSFKGARIRTVDIALINNIFDVRDIIKEYLVRRAALRALPEDVDRIEAIHIEACASYDEGVTTRIAALNAAFNRSVYEVANNPEATATLERVRPLTDALRTRIGYSAERLAEIRKQHEGIIEALRSRDEDGAAYWGMRSSRTARKDLIRFITQLNALKDIDEEGQDDTSTAKKSQMTRLTG